MFKKLSRELTGYGLLLNNIRRRRFNPTTDENVAHTDFYQQFLSLGSLFLMSGPIWAIIQKAFLMLVSDINVKSKLFQSWYAASGQADALMTLNIMAPAQLK